MLQPLFRNSIGLVFQSESLLMCRPVGIVIKSVAKTVAVGVNLAHERLSEGVGEYA